MMTIDHDDGEILFFILFCKIYKLQLLEEIKWNKMVL